MHHQTMTVLLAIASLAIASSATPSRARADTPPPWETAPLTAPADELRRAAAAIPAPPASEAEGGLQYLMDDHLHELHADGRHDYTRYQVYRVVSEAGVENGGFEAVTWRPWFEERPVIEARVLAADGAVHVLAPDTIAEQPVAGEAGTLTDARQLVAPLPAVSPGAVVEVRVRLNESRAPYTSGRFSGFPLGTPNPTLHRRVRIRVPASLPLRWVALGGPAPEPEDERSGDLRVLTFDEAPPARTAVWEPATPPEVSPIPVVYWGTGDSWAAVAAEYARHVEERLAGADVRALAERLAGDTTDVRALAERLVAHIRSDLRYTGLELGAAAVVPAAPATVLQRRYGDCKDLATLLVALFRDRGVAAHVALVRAGGQTDIRAELPSLGAFDHAIVYVPGEPALWIDATAPHVPVGQLPAGLQGRRALVAAPDTTAPVLLPQAVASANSLHVRRTVHIAYEGTGDVVHELTAQGSIGTAYRSLILNDPDGARRSVESWARRELEAADPAAVVLDAPADRDPVTGRVRAERSGLVVEEDGGAGVKLPIWFLLDGLPEPLTQDFATDSEAARRWRAAWLERRHDLLIAPHVREVEYRIVPPAGFVVTRTPPEVTLAAGPLRLTSRVERPAEGGVVVHYRLDTGSGRLTPAETRELHDRIVAWSKTKLDVVAVRYEPDDLLARGRTDEALRRAAELARSHPDVPFLRASFAETLVRAGLPAAGASVAERAVEDFPDAAHPRLVLGWARLHGDLGDWLGPGNDREGAIEAFRALTELPSATAPAFVRLAETCAYDDRGRLLGPGTDADCALAALERLRARWPEDGRGQSLYLTLLTAEGRFDEVLTLAPSFPASVGRNRAWVRALAARGPVVSALDRAAALAEDEDQLVTMVFGAIVQLVELDRLDDAIALVDAAVARRPEWREVFTVIRAGLTDTPIGPPSPVPCRLFQEFSTAIYDGDEDALLSRVPDPLHGEARRLRDSIEAEVRRVADGLLDSTGLTFRDLRASRLLDRRNGCPVEGSATEGFALGAKGGSKFRLFVKPDDDDWLIIPPTPAALGAEALAAADAGRMAEARVWLGRAIAALSLYPSVSPDMLLGAYGGAEDSAALSDAAVATVAAYLAVPAVPEALGRVETALAGLPEGPQRGMAASLLLYLVARTEAAEDVVRLAPVARAGGADELGVGLLLFAALHTRGEREEAQAVLDRLPIERPQARSWRAWAQASLRMHEGELTEARRLLEEAMAADPERAQDCREELAWLALFDGSPLADALTLVGEPAESAEAMHTRATLLAFLDRPGEAIEWLRKSIRTRGGRVARPDDHLVLGRLAESLGAYRAAAEAYGRVEEPDLPQATASHALARKALASLAGRQGGLD